MVRHSDESTILPDGNVTIDGVAIDGGVAPQCGGLYNAGTTYLCDSQIVQNMDPDGFEDDIDGNLPRGVSCEHASPTRGSWGADGGRVLVSHRGKELCLPKAALNGHT